MKNMRHFPICALISLGLLLASARPAWATDTQNFNSPDGAIQLKIYNDGNGQLSYSVTFKGKEIIENSSLIIRVDGINITDGVKEGKITENHVNETYPWRGVHSQATNKYNGFTIPLVHSQSGTEYKLEIRLFNDAMAFRWVVPGDSQEKRIPDEATQFNIPDGSMVWHHNLHMFYEGVHDKDKINDIEKGTWTAPPVTFKLPGNDDYASVTEANLVHYNGMALQYKGNGTLELRLSQHQPISYPYKLRYSDADVKEASQPASITGTITTPWRVVLIGADLNTLVNSDAVHNLCPPADRDLFPGGIQTEWAKPGRAVWKYLDDGGPSTLENMKRFSKLAGQLGFEYNVLEGFWDHWSDADMKELVNYSKKRGVGIIVWKHSKELRDPEARHQFFKHLHDLGVAGAKIDFFDASAKSVTDLYTDILQEAAAYKLVVDFHGASKPTGISRTWPNELAREAVKGMESSSLKDRATHTTTLPFTRYLAGPADYTAVHFGNRRRNTTWANQIASAAILGAPLLTYAANPIHLLKNPAVNMIKSIPSTWDETIVLPVSGIGKMAAYARRKGNTWFLAVMNGVDANSIKVPLSFLGSGSYKAMLVRDNKNDSASVKIENKTFSATDVLTLDLGTGGGFIGRFTPQK